MTILNLRTAKGRRVNNMGLTCNDIFINELYHNPSSAKVTAYKKALVMCRDESGTSFRIGNANSFQFTATWLVNDNGKLYRRVITKDNSYKILL